MHLKKKRTCFDFAEDMTLFYICYKLIEFYFEEPTHQIGPITRHQSMRFQEINNFRPFMVACECDK
jgi:hypothetical protein